MATYIFLLKVLLVSLSSLNSLSRASSRSDLQVTNGKPWDRCRKPSPWQRWCPVYCRWKPLDWIWRPDQYSRKGKETFFLKQILLTSSDKELISRKAYWLVSSSANNVCWVPRDTSVYGRCSESCHLTCIFLCGRLTTWWRMDWAAWWSGPWTWMTFTVSAVRDTIPCCAPSTSRSSGRQWRTPEGGESQDKQYYISNQI